MDANIRNSIDIRKKSIFDYYNVKKENILNEIDELFNKMELMGESSSDVSDFEVKFANSELNNEYLKLIEKVAINCPLKKEHKEVVYTAEERKEDLKEELKDELEYLGDKAYINTKSAIDRKFGIRDKIRRTPILGTLWEVENQTDVVHNFKENLKRKKKEERKLQKELDKELEEELKEKKE